MSGISSVKTKPQRNQSMELCKLIASFFVVFIHVPFPGQAGKLVDCLARFGVPVFFMISGYFNYQASGTAVIRRLKHIVDLILMGTVVHILWACVSTELSGGSTIAYLRAAIPDPIEVVQWIVLHIHPYAGHLWYLNGIAACYLCFWVYTKFWEEGSVNYRGFYQLCMTLFVISFLFDMVQPALGTGTEVLSVRNGWLVGLPMFGAGLFIREYQDRIFARFGLTDKALVWLVVLGAAFSILQWYAADIGVVPFGTLFEVIGLMLLLVSHPTLVKRGTRAESRLLRCGPLSTWIYILHLMLSMAYQQLLQEPLTTLLGSSEAWLRPVIVLAISLAAAFLWDILLRGMRKLRKK